MPTTGCYGIGRLPLSPHGPAGLRLACLPRGARPLPPRGSRPPTQRCSSAPFCNRQVCAPWNQCDTGGNAQPEEAGTQGCWTGANCTGRIGWQDLPETRWHWVLTKQARPDWTRTTTSTLALLTIAAPIGYSSSPVVLPILFRPPQIVKQLQRC